MGWIIYVADNFLDYGEGYQHETLIHEILHLWFYTCGVIPPLTDKQLGLVERSIEVGSKQHGGHFWLDTYF